MHRQEDNIKTDRKEMLYACVDWISMAWENETPDSVQTSKYNKSATSSFSPCCLGTDFWKKKCITRRRLEADSWQVI
jgi:hypothetical protein